MRIFEPALRQLKPGAWSVFGPTSFQKYLRENGFTQRVDTASAISVDSLDRLAPELREAGAMVLRLGKASDGPGTQFALVGTPGRVEEFFLVDREVFSQTSKEVFTPRGDLRELLPYYLLPKLTERSMVHLAFASGLIGYALGLDEPWPTAAPATGSGTYSFRFQPYPGAELLHHREGQVEIDAIFTGRRGGRDLVFVLESKMGGPASLAKHKLGYAALALDKQVPPGIEMVPLYLRCQASESGVEYDLLECQFSAGKTGLVGLCPRFRGRLWMPVSGS